MKKITTITIGLVLSLTSFANIWRVNNIPDINANFNTLQAAHDGASSHDTIYVEGSPNNYDDLHLNKPLVIIGTGYFLTENPQTQALPYISKASQFYFHLNSEGSILMGFSLDAVWIRTSNITLMRNRIISSINLNDSTNSYTVSNITISQNYIASCNNQYNIANVIFNNNIVTSTSTPNGNCMNFFSNCIYATVYNNSFASNVSFKNTVFRNNFINGGYSSASQFFSCVIQNNIFNDPYYNYFVTPYSPYSYTSISDTTYNKFGRSRYDVFTFTGSNDAQYKLVAGSLAIGYASGGGDCGPFGGTAPYVLSGIPPIPAIWELVSSPSGNSSTGINVNIKAKSH